MTESKSSGWMSRNWKWAVPVGCGLPVLLCGGFVVSIVSVVFGAIKSSDVYQQAVAAAKAHPQVVKALREPIETGFVVSGNIKVNGNQWHAELSIPIKGPNGEATIDVLADKMHGQWEFKTLDAVLSGTGERIPLSTKEMQAEKRVETPAE